jgi:uncharacterized protein YjiK
MRAHPLMWAAACAWLALATPAAAEEGGKKKKPQGAAKAAASGPLGTGTSFTVAGVREPSGVAWHAALSRLFVVGDDGTVAELDGEGRTLHTATVGGNLEDVTVHVPSGLLVLLGEARSELIAWDPKARRETARFPLDAAALLGSPPADRRQGFEGVYFREMPGRAGGGVFYLVHQRGPAAVVTIAFDPTRSAAGPLGRDAVVARWPAVGREDLTAITYAPALDRMLVIAEAGDRLLAFSADGVSAGEIPLPGVQQEGLCVDGGGRLWVADDRGGTLTRFDGLASALGKVAAPEGEPAAQRR